MHRDTSGCSVNYIVTAPGTPGASVSFVGPDCRRGACAQTTAATASTPAAATVKLASQRTLLRETPAGSDSHDDADKAEDDAGDAERPRLRRHGRCLHACGGPGVHSSCHPGDEPGDL